MPCRIRMSNGVHIPFMGLGTGGKHATVDETRFQLRTALDLGYRHIDTAQMYDNENTIGEILAEYISQGKVRREELFVTTKLPPTANRPSFVIPCFEKQLKDLRLDYVDLYLIHSPASLKSSNGSFLMNMHSGDSFENDIGVDLNATWKEMEKLYEKGVVKAIGLSNFNLEQIQRIYSSAKIKPMNLQIEMHLYWPQKELLTMCQSLNITVTAYAPMGCPGKKGIPGWPEKGPIDDFLVNKLAEKYGKTTGQILLRYLTQRNVIVVPKSTNEQRLRENFESSNFFMSDSDLNALNNVQTRHRFYCWPTDTMSHPEYPFLDKLNT